MTASSRPPRDASPPQEERIAKVLARAGVCSRRDAERLIASGRVVLNGIILATPSVLVSAQDHLVVDGKPVAARQPTRLWRYHKPAGLVTTHRDPQGRPTVFQSLPQAMPRVVSVGRLDLNSEGLLLLTNDGELARRLELPSTGWTRRYRVRVFGSVDPAKFHSLAEGATIDGIVYGPVAITLERQQGTNAWLLVTLAEGKNREIRRIMEHLGYRVNRLIRTAYGPFQLDRLPVGAVEDVSPRMLHDLLAGEGDSLSAFSSPRKPRGWAKAQPKAKRKRDGRASGPALKTGGRTSKRIYPADDQGGSRTRRDESPPERTGARTSKRTYPADDQGGSRTRRDGSPPERTGARTSKRTYPADDQGGSRTRRDESPPERTGARASKRTYPADDQGGSRTRRDGSPPKRTGARASKRTYPADGQGGSRTRRDGSPPERTGARASKRTYPADGQGGSRTRRDGSLPERTGARASKRTYPADGQGGSRTRRDGSPPERTGARTSKRTYPADGQGGSRTRRDGSPLERTGARTSKRTYPADDQGGSRTRRDGSPPERTGARASKRTFPADDQGGSRTRRDGRAPTRSTRFPRGGKQ